MSTTTSSPSGDLWGHPKGLYVCFATELWERFSFYGMKYLLLLYLTKYHLFSDAAWGLLECGVALHRSRQMSSPFLSAVRLVCHAASDRDGAIRACAICVGSLMRLTSLNNAPA